MCSRVFGRNGQDISMWGIMRGDYVKNSGTHYLCPSAQPFVHLYAGKETRT